jgi:hypothetical protein
MKPRQAPSPMNGSSPAIPVVPGNNAMTPPPSTRGLKFSPAAGGGWGRGDLNEASEEGTDAKGIDNIVSTASQGFPPVPSTHHHPASQIGSFMVGDRDRSCMTLLIGGEGQHAASSTRCSPAARTAWDAKQHSQPPLARRRWYHHHHPKPPLRHPGPPPRALPTTSPPLQAPTRSQEPPAATDRGTAAGVGWPKERRNREGERR